MRRPMRIFVLSILSVSIAFVSTNVFAEARGAARYKFRTQTSLSSATQSEKSLDAKVQPINIEKNIVNRANYKDLNLKKLDLFKCIEIALGHNAKIKGSEFGVSAARYQQMETKALFWPIVEYKYQMAPVPKDVDDALKQFFDGNLTMLNRLYTAIAFPVTTFGKLLTANKLAREGIRVSMAEQAKTKEEVIFQIKQLYYGIQLAYELRNIMQEALDKIQNYLNDQEVQDVDAENSPFELTRLRMFRNELKKKMLEIEEKNELAYAGLKVQMGIPFDYDIALKTHRLKPRITKLSKLDEYVKTAQVYQPDRQRLEAGVNAARLKYKLEKRNLLPNAGFAFFFEMGRTTSEVVGITATDDYQDPFNFTRAGIGLEIRGKIDFFGSYSKIKKARAVLYKALMESSIARDGLDLRMKQAYLTAKRTESGVKLARKGQSMANQMLFLSRSNLDLGIGNQQDYVESLKAVLLARGEYYKAVFDYNLAVATLQQEITKQHFENITTFPKIEEHEFFSDNLEGVTDGKF